ncbi:unannotated protein [freshwater metagenome]|uniref:Unannotated protein n=1 Tax=freshwater metagenome TaxID=449393 RepID=A0A6J7LVA1_9ZZZZ
MLEEGDHRRRDRPELARRDIHVVDVVGEDVVDLAALASDEDARIGHVAFSVNRGVRLGDHVEVFLVGGQVVDIVGDPAVDDLAVRGLDETERVDSRIRRERSDQADIGAFRGLDRAHAAVVRRVNVANLEASALTRQTARAEGREATLVGQARERIRLIHELRQL